MSSDGDGIRTWLQANGWEWSDRLTVEGDGWVKLLDAAADEIERLRALVNSVLACDGSDRTTHVTVEIPFDLYHLLEEARRER